MATKLVNTVEVTVYTFGGGEFTATDGEGSKAGTNAFYAFEHGNVIEIPGEGSTTYVPYHAIDHITVTKTSESATYEDDTCVTE